MLDRAIRELDRERMGLQTQEKKLIAEIKKMAKEGQMVSGSGGGGSRTTFCTLHRRFLSDAGTSHNRKLCECRKRSRSWPRAWCATGTPSTSSSS